MRVITTRKIRKAKKGKRIIYRIWYGDEIVYVGRTTQQLTDRLRGHFFRHKRYIIIDINQVTKIEYQEHRTIADMYLYEVYYINMFHPRLNRDDRAPDELTVKLPAVKWTEYVPRLMDEWRERENQRRAEQEEKSKARKKEVKKEKKSAIQ